MVGVNLIERIATGYYNFMSGKSSLRYRMYLSLDKLLVHKLSFLNNNNENIYTRFIDYSSERDRLTKEIIHSDIFDVNYDCHKFIEKMSKSSEARNGYGLFFVKSDDEGNEEIIGSCDFLNYNGLFILGNFGLIHNYRSNGYSPICLYNALSVLVDKNIDKVFLFVMKNNFIAKHLYECFGFETF